MFLVATATAVPPWVTASGFVDAAIDLRWRNEDMDLVPGRVFRRRASTGESIVLPAAAVDFAVLVRP